MAEKPKDGKQTITLMDGTEVEIRPLKLSLLRPFMTRFSDLSSVADNDDKSMDVLMDCVLIAMKQYNTELAEDKNKLEELIDLPTVYQIIDAASGFQNADISVIAGLTK